MPSLFPIEIQGKKIFLTATPKICSFEEDYEKEGDLIQLKTQDDDMELEVGVVLDEDDMIGEEEGEGEGEAEVEEEGEVEGDRGAM